MPLIQMFDKQINLRMGQANVKRWIDDILPLVSGDDDPLGVEDFATHHVPLGRGAARLRDLPEEGGRRVQDPAPAVVGVRSPARASSSRVIACVSASRSIWASSSGLRMPAQDARAPSSGAGG